MMNQYRDQIRSFLRISSHLLKKSLMENFILCAVEILPSTKYLHKKRPLISSYLSPDLISFCRNIEKVEGHSVFIEVKFWFIMRFLTFVYSLATTLPFERNFFQNSSN